MMKRQLFKLWLLLCCCTAQAADNPMIWADLPDPDVIRVDDTFYLVSTTMHMMPAVPIMKSKDLINWEIASYVCETLDDSPRYGLLEGTVYGRGQWATSLKYHNGRFYVLFVPNEGGDMGRTYIYSAEKAEGPWTLVSRLPHFHDASLLFDDDGRVYVYYGTGEQVELTADLQGVVPNSHRQIFQREADETGLLEGSRVVKHMGRYYLLMISQVYAPGRHRREVCYRADNPAGPYEKQVILEAPYGGFGYTGQGTIVDTQWGDWYGVIFQDRGAVGRVPLLMPCRWIDGWPMLGDEDGQIPIHMRPLTSTSKPLNSTSQRLNVSTSDDFSADRLAPEWQWNHNPVNSAWSLTDRKGWLRLKTCRVVDNLYLAPNTLTQRMMGPKCSATVTLDASHLKNGDCAGFAAFNGHSGVLTVKREKGKFFLEMSEQVVSLGRRIKEVEKVDETVVQRISLAKPVVYLRIDGDFHPRNDKAQLYYSLDGSEWTKIADYQMRFDWQRLFMGTRYALFCYTTQRTGGYADFDAFNFQVINDGE